MKTKQGNKVGRGDGRIRRLNRRVMFQTRLLHSVVFVALALTVLTPTGAFSRPRPALPIFPEEFLRIWRFDDEGWWESPAPLALHDVEGIESWSGYALQMQGHSSALLRYRETELDGGTNFVLSGGTVRCWFAPAWTSASLGGQGPGAYGRIIEAGSFNGRNRPGSAAWALYFNPEGTALSVSVRADRAVLDLVSAPVQWRAGEWHLIALTYSPLGTALYVDGQLAAEGNGIPVSTIRPLAPVAASPSAATARAATSHRDGSMNSRPSTTNSPRCISRCITSS